MCRSGYLASNGRSGLTQLLRNGENDVCVPAINSGNVIVTSTTITMIFSSRTVVHTSDIYLTRHDLDGNVDIDIEDKVSRVDENTSLQLSDATRKQYVMINDLRPGYRYTITAKFRPFGGSYNESVEAPTVLSCSGISDTADLTGRPRNFQVHQMNGHVMFQFVDNSLCEEAFSFSRSSEVDEFLTDFSAGAVSFTSDYYFTASTPYESLIMPELEASDDLRLTELDVGKRYAYCVRAIKQDHYMDSPYEGVNERRLLTSSEAACAAHTIAWEASIDGIVTTVKTAVS